MRLLIVFVGQGGAAFGAPNTITRIHTIPEAQEVVDLFLSHGQSGFDTARSYGYGTSEEVCPQVHVDEHILTIRPRSSLESLIFMVLLSIRSIVLCDYLYDTAIDHILFAGSLLWSLVPLHQTNYGRPSKSVSELFALKKSAYFTSTQQTEAINRFLSKTPCE